MTNTLLISNKKKYKLPSFLLYLLLIISITQCNEKQEITCGDKIIPSWSKAAFYFNANTLTKSSLIDIIKNNKKLSSKIDEINLKYNINLYTDLNCMSGGFSTIDIGAKNSEFIIFIKIKYDTDKFIEATKRQYKISEEIIQEHKVISTGYKGQNIKTAFIEDKYIIIASSAKINEGIDIITKNKTGPLNNQKLYSAIKNVNKNNLFWIALESPSLPIIPKDGKPDIITISSNISDNLNLSLKGFSKSELSAKLLTSQLRGILLIGRSNINKVLPLNIIDKIKIENEGYIVNTSLNLTNEDIKKLTTKIE